MRGKPKIAPVLIILGHYFKANIDRYQSTNSATKRKVYFLGCIVIVIAK